MANPQIVHWASQYIGLPWELRAAGPGAYDCYQFVRHIEKTHFNIELPDIDGYFDWRVSATELAHNPEREKWVQVTRPIEGDLVMMARNMIPVHIGVYIKANNTVGVLHCQQHSGVVFNSIHSLPTAGWGSIKYYRKKVTG